MLLPDSRRFSYWLMLHIKQTIYYVFDFFLFNKRNKILKSLKNIKTKKRAVIICGGPSFDEKMIKHILENRKELDVYAINYYCLNKISAKIIPDFYLLSDPHNFSFNIDRLKEKNKQLDNYLYDNSINLIAPYGIKSELKRQPNIFFNDIESLLFGKTSPIYARGYRSNSSFKAISMASFFDYESIIVCGLEYNYPKKLLIKNRKLILLDEHHYGFEESDYNIHFKNMSHALNWWSYDYKYINKFSDNRIKIYSNETYIDSFEEYKIN